MNHYKRLVFVALFLLFVESILARQATFQDSFLDHLVGKWVLRGELAGKTTTHDITSEWVLGHQYVRLHEISRETNTNGFPAYEANLYIGGFFERD